jgi:uncharacterized protein (DUF3084 family)
MTTAQIQDWLTYWKNGGMVAVDAIRALDQVYQARKFCRVMREGIFTPDQVSDGQIWDAIVALRQKRAA